MYRPLVVAQRTWTGKVTKLAMAKQLVLLARSGPDERKIFLLCDSWYPKKLVAQLTGFPNLTITCNARHDSAMYGLPQRPEKPRRGRPRVYGEKVPTADFELAPIPGTEWRAGSRTAKTTRFGNREVTAMITRKGKTGGLKTFLLHGTRSVRHVCGASQSITDDARSFMPTDAALVPRRCTRWTTETSCPELKTFRDFLVSAHGV